MQSMLKYEYIRPNSPNQFGGGVTLVGSYHNGDLYMGVAVCNKKDQFNKKYGRYLAEIRAAWSPLVFENIKEGQYSLKELFMIAADKLA